MRTLLALGLAILSVLLSAVPGAAYSESGSHGWSRQLLVLRDGPGPQYHVTGEIAGDVAIKILRCQKLWCVVDGPGGRGWTSKDFVDFGKDPAWPLFDGDRITYDLTGGTVCFFEGTHFSGQSFCVTGGQVFPDLALNGWDNRVGSISVDGTSAAICRDRNFQSYCERIVESQPVLDPLLVRNLSSIRVY
jgi:hypothetical protein